MTYANQSDVTFVILYAHNTAIVCEWN